MRYRSLAVIRLSVCSLAFVALQLPASSRADAPAFGTSDLFSVSVRGNFAAVTGDRGAVYFVDLKRWKVRPQRVPTTVGISSVAIDGRGRVWTAGLGGQFLHWDGKRWTSPIGSTSRSFFGIAMLPRNRGIVVGHSRLFFRKGGQWARFNGGPKGTWRDVVSINRSAVVAVGDKGKAMHVRHGARTVRAKAEPTGSSADLTGVAACARGEAVAVGANRTVLIRRANGRWASLPSAPAEVRAVAVRCRGRRVVEIYAAGGAAVHRLAMKGTNAWRTRGVPGATSINDVAWAGRRHLLVVGKKGFAKRISLRAER